MADPKKNKTKPQPPLTAQNFPIVGIGASAGGLEAFKCLLAAISETSGMAYVLVQHLDPKHESLLPEILQRFTKIPVLEITNDIPLAPNHIYVIPSNKMLISTDGILQLSNREKKINTAIDVFFTSLAEVHKECAVGVVLSGTGTDGTIGLKAIKEHGGISIVQDSESATYDSMPQNAVNAGVVDFILAPEKIPAQLLEINSAYKISHFFKEEEDELPKDDEHIFKQILSLLRQRSGVDFTYYKQPTFHRRIARRIAIVKKNNLVDYLKLLRTDKAEQDALFQDVLIPVTSFFRDPKTFHALTETVFPSILKNKSSDEAIRIWIAGCSTGEEAFSIAICLHEFLGEKLSNTKIQIFASDISEKVIKKARTAIYTKADVEMLSEIQIKTYFVKNSGGYEVNKLIRDMCVFAPHNFLKDPPFAKMDLISCRNVLIYMGTFLQKKAFTTFHYALKENGFLLLGKSETTGTSSDLFTQVNKNEKIYLRKPVPGRFLHLATENTFNLQMKDLKVSLSKADANASSGAGGLDFKKSAEAIMVAKSPPSVVINEQMDIVHIHGDITPFLQAPQGKPTYNLLKMAREGLAFELRNAIHKATKEQVPVSKENIPVKANEKQSLVTIEVIPLTDIIEPHSLIRFEKNTIQTESGEKKHSSRKTVETQRQNEQLEKQLSQTHEDMRSITEDMEAANEELQSANEELQSSNEEMQSLNEELETSKEELQSTNEELIIVNQELLDKQEQLNAARYYSDSIFTTIREPLIVLDKKLRIKTANASFYKKFNAEEHEIEGKLFYQIQNHQWDDSEMRSLLESILPQKDRLVDFEISIKFRTLGERHLLMNALQIKNDNGSEQLILLAIEDITERKTAEQKIETTNIILKEKNKLIKASEKRFSNILSQSLMAIAILKSPEMIVNFANEAIIDIWGKGKNVIGKPLVEVLPEIKNQVFPQLLTDVYNTGVHFASNEIKCVINRNGQEEDCYFNLIYQPFRDVDDTITGVVVIATEVTEQVLAKNRVQENEEEQIKIAGHLKLATDAAKVGIWSLDIASLKLDWSDIHKIMWGYDEKQENLTYEDWYKVILPEDKEIAFQKIEESKVNHTVYDVDYRIKRANDGEIVWIKSTGQFQYDEFGVAHTLSGISIDISEQKRIDAELLEAKSKAEIDKEIAVNATIAKQQFLSNMSHEIRTPMNAIVGFTKVLLKTDITEKQKEYLHAIKSSGDTLIVLINDILDLAKVDEGKMSFANAPFKMAESVKVISHLFETKIEENNIALVKEYDTKIPEILLGDVVRLHQILINLLGNAVKFTKKGKITLSIDLLEEDKEKVTLEIKVSDTGIGIPKNKIATIFEKFEQAGSDTSSLYGGTGLGLAIVKQLVEKQGGTIAVESKINKGSIFSFTLSFQKTNTEIVENASASKDDQTETLPLKILVVEDVKLNQLLLRTILDDFQFEYDIADNGKIAVEKLETNTYDIILMDLQMPIMNGFEATEYIRKTLNLKIPIIALTADVTTVDVEKCRAVGMNDYVSKPLDEEILHRKILELVKRK